MRGRALLALLPAVLLLGGCGSGGEEERTSSEASAAQAATTQQSDEGRGAVKQDAKGAADQTPPAPNPPRSAERIPGSKAVAPGVPVTPGADNSVQAFGTEGEESQATRAAATLSAYLDARRSGNWPGACEEASAEFKRQLEVLIERAKAKDGAEKPEGCAETLQLLAGAGQGPEAGIEEVLSFRIREPYAYLIYEDPKGAVKFIAMANDDGTWKVNTVEPEAFEGTQGETQ